MYNVTSHFHLLNKIFTFTADENGSSRSTSKHKSDKRRKSKGKRPTYDSSSESHETSDDEADDSPPRRAGRKKSADPFGGDMQKVAATHDFAPHTPPKKQFMYWGGDPESAAVMLIDRFVNNLAHILPSHYQLTLL